MMATLYWELFADELCPPGERRDAMAGVLRQFYAFLQHEGMIETVDGLCVDGSRALRDYDDLGEPEGDSDTRSSELDLLIEIRDELRELKKEVRAMANNETLDQAVNDLGTAVTNKLAVDQQLDTAEANLAGDTAKVQQLTSQLNAETAAEQAELNPTPVVPNPTPVPVPVTTTDPNAPNGIKTTTDTGASSTGATS